MSDELRADSATPCNRLTTSLVRTRVPGDLGATIQVAEDNGQAFETILLGVETGLGNKLPKGTSRTILVALSHECLLLSRQNDLANEFFSHRSRILPHGAWGLAKGSGNWGFDLGLWLRHGGIARACRILDAEGKSFAVVLAVPDFNRVAEAALRHRQREPLRVPDDLFDRVA
jgi:hypothetical protein